VFVQGHCLTATHKGDLDKQPSSFSEVASAQHLLCSLQIESQNVFSFFASASGELRVKVAIPFNGMHRGS
jgi:hypothetical protein